MALPISVAADASGKGAAGGASLGQGRYFEWVPQCNWYWNRAGESAFNRRAQ